MTIQEAIRSERPFRRKAWTVGNPAWMSADKYEIYGTYVDHSTPTFGPQIMKDEGYRVSLRVEDILADDWEVKP